MRILSLIALTVFSVGVLTVDEADAGCGKRGRKNSGSACSSAVVAAPPCCGGSMQYGQSSYGYPGYGQSGYGQSNYGNPGMYGPAPVYGQPYPTMGGRMTAPMPMPVR